LASVSIVSSTDFRANLSQPQNNAPEGDDPFSLLLNSVADVKASAQRPDAPEITDRRKDAPAKQSKPETDADRQAKRQAKDATKPEAKPQSESSAPVKEAVSDGDTEETEDESDDTASADALLMIALGEAQQQTAVIAQAGDANAAAQATATVVATVSADGSTEIQTAPALAAAIADVTAAAPTETQAAQTVQGTAAAKPKFEIAPVTAQAEAETEIALPKITAETVSSLMKPVKTASSVDVQTQVQPGSIQVASATPVQGPSPLEMLNAAISKHMQLALGADASEQPQDGVKPQISSNAVAPNFAMTAQVNAPVQVQTQQVAEAARAVPLDQLAVEIATRANKGERRFDIRLDPPELGRIDVRLEIDSKGNTTTKLIVERAETLDMLQRDARGLEKALQNAGLKTDAGGMQFSLQQDTQAQHGNQNHAPELRSRPDLIQGETEVLTEISVGNATLAAQLRGGVDIRI
jgi:flagellar hook-length control protein FliK